MRKVLCSFGATTKLKVPNEPLQRLRVLSPEEVGETEGAVTGTTRGKFQPPPALDFDGIECSCKKLGNRNVDGSAT
jgi:hypothetical protein